jgi:hypothetical protein
MLAELKQSLDLAAIVAAAGVELRPAGPGRLKGLCPFHQERTGSFFVFQDRGRWHCFGCGEHGDAIDFIRRLRGCSFREALEVLGLESPERNAAELALLRSERRKRETERWRERELARTLGTAIRIGRRALERITPESFTSQFYSLLLSELSILEHQHDVLISGDAEDRAAVVADWQGVRLFERQLLFRKDFDYRGWCRSIMEPPCKEKRSGNSPTTS